MIPRHLHVTFFIGRKVDAGLVAEVECRATSPMVDRILRGQLVIVAYETGLVPAPS